MGEEGDRCLVRQKCETLFILVSSNQQHPLEGPKQDQGRCYEAGSSGPKYESVQPNQGCGRGPMCFGFPGPALILVVSAAPREQTVERVEDETNQKLASPTTGPHSEFRPLAFHQFPTPRRLPWNRSIGTQPPEPKAGSKTRLGALPPGSLPHRSWSGGYGRGKRENRLVSLLHTCYGLNCIPPKVVKILTPRT